MSGICSLSDGQEREFQDAGGHPRPEERDVGGGSPMRLLIAIQMHLTETRDLGEEPQGISLDGWVLGIRKDSRMT
jgi:hypothetical protein